MLKYANLGRKPEIRTLGLKVGKMLREVQIYSIGTPVYYQGQLAEIISSTTTQVEAGVVLETDKEGNTYFAHLSRFVTEYDIQLFSPIADGRVCSPEGREEDIPHEDLDPARFSPM